MSEPETAALPGGTVTVAMLGQFAQTVLRAHSRGAMLAVFHRSFYVQFDDDVVCVGPPGLGKGPLNVLAVVSSDLEWPALGLAPKQNVLRSASVLSVGENLRFEFGGADVWQPPAAPAFSQGGLRTGLRRLAASVRRRSPGGLGAIIAALDEPSLSRVLQDDPLLSVARRTIAEIGRWLDEALAGSAKSSPPIESLIALGPGLTPSGDDFLCGVMAALNYCGHKDIAARLAASVLPLATRETSLISAAYLRCAAKGQASGVLFDVLEKSSHRLR